MLQRRSPHQVTYLRILLLIVPLAMIGITLGPRPVVAKNDTFSNPLPVRIPGDGRVESCADPTILRGHDGKWYMYCTSDPLNDDDRNTGGDFNFHLIPTLRSSDLVSWTYAGDAFDFNAANGGRPSWTEPTSGIWAPEVDYRNGRYYLYFVATDVKPEVSGVSDCGGDSAIGVATSSRPTGPWTYEPTPVVMPRQNGPGCDFFWTYDPEVIVAKDRTSYIYFGSYYGGIMGDRLSPDGLHAAGSPTQVTIPNRYEGAEVVYRNGYYYLYGSATNCCNGPLTGYAVFAGRSQNPLGPFVDREGVSLLAGRVGGTPAVMQNGNRWVGPGHNSVFQDLDGQWWTMYHAVDRSDPYFEDAVGFTKRPVLLDAIDWIDGWPMLNSGRGPSDRPQAAPAAQRGDRSKHRETEPALDRPGKLIAADEFNGSILRPNWSWVREPAAGTFGVENGAFRFDTQAADLFVDSNNASVLTLPIRKGDYIVETKLQLNLPPEGCCFNYVQAGLVIYGDDDNFIKLAHVSIWETRQTEFAKELAPVPDGYPRYGNSVGGPPSDWTYLRIVKHAATSRHDQDTYTEYTSQDGKNWVRGAVWTHTLGTNERIGLVSMGGSGFVARFDYVRVYTLK